MKMKKFLKAIGLMLAAAMILILLGCSSMQDAVTPCWIDARVGEYTGEPLTSIMPYTTIADSKRLDVFMKYQHDLNQVNYLYQMDRDVDYVDLIQKVQRGHNRRAAELKGEIFSPTGTGSILLGMLPAGILGS
ncbi:MAG: hypothetical protein ACYS30_24210, partial [Planctomycetota bacterium]